MGQSLGDFFDQSKFQQKQKKQVLQADKTKAEPDKPGQPVAKPVKETNPMPPLPSVPNLGWKYQKEYFKAFAGTTAKADLARHHAFFFKEVTYASYQPLVSLLDMNAQMPKGSRLQTIRLTTTYPGLVTGTGNSHETKREEGELKLGFLFDHTTGLPYISGSSVKGKLRSYFTAHLLEKIKSEKGEEKKRLTQKARQIQDYFAHEIFPEWKTKARLAFDFSEEMYQALEKELFERRDVFLDAYVCHVKAHPDKTKPLFLGDDSITPHPHPLKNPIPLQFMKILPGVTFCFQFLLQKAVPQTEAQETRPANQPFALALEPDQKQTLLKLLLLDGGIGAKTRHNYGQFTEFTS